MTDKYFLKTPYLGQTNEPYDEEFRRDFVAYLEHVIATREWRCLSEHTLFLQGGKTALEEVIAEIKNTL